jgi:hypothetical protein
MPRLAAPARALLLLLAAPAAAWADPPAAPTGPAPAPCPAPAPPPGAGATPASEATVLGARYFDQSIAWVAKGGALGRARDVYVDALAVLDVPGQHHFEGRQLLWFLAPDKMRVERLEGGAITSKILDGDRAWAVLAGGAVSRLHGSPDGAEDLKQLKEDLGRVQDLAAFLTLEGLKGENVVFEFQGAVEGTGGATAGKWLKVARRAPDGRKMTFWFAYENDPQGAPHATWPGVCRVDGDVQAELWTEEWVLKGWDAPDAKPRPYRYPMKIQGWRYPGEDRAKAQKFAVFNLDDIQINAGIDPARFAAPPEPKKPG